MASLTEKHETSNCIASSPRMQLKGPAWFFACPLRNCCWPMAKEACKEPGPFSCCLCSTCHFQQSALRNHTKHVFS
jgi:hypothetical protein